MNRKGLFQGIKTEKPEPLQAYENSKAKTHSLYLDPDQYAEIISYYVSKQQFNEAKEALDYAKRIHHKNIQIAIEEAYLYLEMNEPHMAQLVAQQISGVKSYELTLLLAEIALKRKKATEAEVILATLEDKVSIHQIIDIAYLHIDYEEFNKAYEWISKADKKHQKNEEYLLLCADYYFAIKEYEQSELLFNRLLDLNPFSPFYWWGLALTLFEQSKFIAAIDACEMGLTNDQTHVDLLVLKGQIFQTCGQHVLAIGVYEKALTLNCTDAESVQLLLSYSKAILENKTTKTDQDKSSNPLSASSRRTESQDAINPNRPHHIIEQNKAALTKHCLEQGIFDISNEYNTQDLLYFQEQVKVIEEITNFVAKDRKEDEIEDEYEFEYEEKMSPHELHREELIQKLKNLIIEAYDSGDIHYVNYLIFAIYEVHHGFEHLNIIADAHCYIGDYEKALNIYLNIYESYTDSDEVELHLVKFAHAYTLFYNEVMEVLVDQKILDKAREIIDIDNSLAVIKFLNKYKNESLFQRIISKHLDTNSF